MQCLYLFTYLVFGMIIEMRFASASRMLMTAVSRMCELVNTLKYTCDSLEK